jgi:hypothetical protein
MTQASDPHLGGSRGYKVKEQSNVHGHVLAAGLRNTTAPSFEIDILASLP